MAAVSNYDLDLEGCAKEPIHIPGGIQPHGALLVLDPRTLEVLQASTNAAQLLGTDIERGTTRAFDAVGGPAVTRQLRTWLDAQDGVFLRTAALGGRNLQFLGHRTGQGVILEIE